jgi:DNA-dependent RNA polymerase auxiliary subunit epsilon
MSFESAYQKKKYVTKAREKLQEIYSFGERKTADRAKLHDQLEGYFKAGLLLDIVSEDDVRTIVEEEHHLAFGTSLKERRIKEKLTPQATATNWKKFDIPTIHRR